MSFYKEIIPFMEYIHSIRKLENYLSFDIKFPVKWNLPKNMTEDSQTIPFEVGVENLKGVSFVSKLDESEVSTILTKILKIIKFNKEREVKEKLFKETVERLKSTFEKTDLDKLQKLYFDFESDYDENLTDDEPNTENVPDTEMV
jgi:hypothetical protein